MDLFNRKKVKELNEQINRLEEKNRQLREENKSFLKYTEELKEDKSKMILALKELNEEIDAERQCYKDNSDIQATTLKRLNLANEKLKEENKRLNHKVDWLKDNMRAPSKEEIIAYDRGYKEVERRQKEADKKRREGVKSEG